MAIRWADGMPEHVLETQVFNRKDVRIPPHEMHYEKTNYYQFSTDVLIYALAPHMHYRGKDFSLYKVEHPQTDAERRQLVLRVAGVPLWLAAHLRVRKTAASSRRAKRFLGDALRQLALQPQQPEPARRWWPRAESEQEMLNVPAVKYEIVDFGDEP